MGKGSLYHAFGSKRELFDRALRRYGRAGAELTAEVLDRPVLHEVIDTALSGL